MTIHVLSEFDQHYQLYWVLLNNYTLVTYPGSYKYTIFTKRKRTENTKETNEKRTNASHERTKHWSVHVTV